jgi:hypothetical protein
VREDGNRPRRLAALAEHAEFVFGRIKTEATTMRDFLWKYRIQVFLFAVLFLFVIAPAFAMQVPVPVTPVPPNQAMDIGEKVIVIAGVVSAALQGLKKFIPQISGNVAIVISIAGALAGAYAVAQPGQVVSVQFLITTLGAALSSNGIYSLLKKPQSQVASKEATSTWHT